MKTKLFLLAGACALMAGAAHAQTSATTVDDIVCKMSNTCDAAALPADAQKQQVGDEKMFSMQKTQPAAGGQTTGQKTGPEKMFSMQQATPSNTTSAPAASSSGGPTYYKASTSSGTKSSKSKATKTTKASYTAPAAPSHDMTMQVHFQLGSAELTDDTRGELSKYVEAMNRPELASMKFSIDGHTDSSGKRSTNMDLSQRRAQSVVDYLIANGVSAERLSAHGYGPDHPLAGYKKSSPSNRRVELVRVD